MNNYFNLYIVGTSHISKQSINEIKKAFDDLNPEILAIELDKGRAYALMSEKQSKLSLYHIKRIGLKGFLFALIGSWVSKKLGKLVGVQPGSEMKTAMLLAKKNKTKIALIDQDIELTLKKFSKHLSWKEKWNLMVDILKGIFLRKKDPLLNFDLSKVPEKKLIKLMMAKVKERYPNIHKVLIEERNYYMARKIKRLMSDNPQKKILAIVGAGHEEDILKILKENEGITYSFTVTQ
ncbi:MAG: TraB/GumN family protein [Nanoarchaeota archaeon]|nr:TraB/GumN family protein [Nanoarchaeota archaeon]